MTGPRQYLLTNHLNPVLTVSLALCRTSDLLCTCTDASSDLQPFWEAFPAAGGGRTTYMFTYADADKRRPSFEVKFLVLRA